MRFINFMATNTGRGIRIAAGLALIALGAAFGGGWWALAVVGLVPLAAGAFDFCILAPLVHQPFNGRRFRSKLHGAG